MRLTLDVTPFVLRSAGVKNHLFYWSEALERTRGAHRIGYYPFFERLQKLDHDHGRESGVPDWRLFLVAAMNVPALQRAVRYAVPEVDLMHGSPQMRLRPRCRRFTSHIHDLTCWLMPEMHTPANVRAAQQTASHAWREADGLIAVSQSARDDAVRILGLNASKIEVIYHGVPDVYFSARKPDGGENRPYVLSVGTIEPRKNLERVLNAWDGLPEDVRDSFDLVVAGPVGWKAEGTVQRLRSASRGVKYLGYVDEAKLPALTAGAVALAYPSLYEGFGFPLAQAMACGVPSVTSNVSSLPEVAAGSALLIDPRSEMEIREALFRLLTSPDLRIKLGEIGRKHATAHYRWEIAARQSWAFFERVAAR